MQSITLTLPWTDAALSPNARVHHMARARAVKNDRNYAWGMTKAVMGPLRISPSSWVGPITVQYTFHPEMDRDRDDDNFAARMKASRDGIARALGVDDNDFMQLPVIFGAKAKPGCVLLTVTPAMVSVPVRGKIG